MEKQRIQKVISQLGYCSRRKAEEYLRLGLIEVNGTKVTEMGFLCTPEDEIKIDGKIINPKEEIKSVYLMVNKPIDVISTAFDPQGRRTVLDLVPIWSLIHRVLRKKNTLFMLKIRFGAMKSKN